jgi:hypothetical protein
VVEESK